MPLKGKAKDRLQCPFVWKSPVISRGEKEEIEEKLCVPPSPWKLAIDKLRLAYAECACSRTWRAVSLITESYMLLIDTLCWADCPNVLPVYREAMKHVLDSTWAHVCYLEDPDQDHADLKAFVKTISHVNNMDYRQKSAIYAIRSAFSELPDSVMWLQKAVFLNPAEAQWYCDLGLIFKDIREHHACDNCDKPKCHCQGPCTGSSSRSGKARGKVKGKTKLGSGNAKLNRISLEVVFAEAAWVLAGAPPHRDLPAVMGVKERLQVMMTSSSPTRDYSVLGPLPSMEIITLVESVFDPRVPCMDCRCWNGQGCARSDLLPLYATVHGARINEEKMGPLDSAYVTLHAAMIYSPIGPLSHLASSLFRCCLELTKDSRYVKRKRYEAQRFKL